MRASCWSGGECDWMLGYVSTATPVIKVLLIQFCGKSSADFGDNCFLSLARI